MKLSSLISATLAAGLAGATLIPAGAMAAPVRTVTTTHTIVRHVDNGHRRSPRTRQVCTYQTRNHHRVRVCRTVRAR